VADQGANAEGCKQKQDVGLGIQFDEPLGEIGEGHG
tara:strand:- start:4025 stop:4132 length:108 start_codon:yes stop_codon:yes gene_type:complete